MRAVLAAVLALPLAAPAGGLAITPANAASFDCGKAQTFIEKAVCGNDELSAADSRLATAYATALGGLTADAAASMRASQKAWLDFVQRACTQDAKPPSKPYSADDGACLINFYAERAADLENSRMIGGYRFFLADSFRAVRDPDTADQSADGSVPNPVATNVTSYSVMDGGSALAQGFNAFMRKESSAGLSTDGSEDSADTTTDNWVTAADEAMITVTEMSSLYEHGAAHGEYGLSFAHYLVKEQRPLATADVFAKAGWEDRLRPLVTTALKQQLGDDGLLDGWQASVRDETIDPSRWDFSKQGLVVQFNPYEVAPYAAGPVAVTVPWTAVWDDLTEAAQGHEYN